MSNNAFCKICYKTLSLNDDSNVIEDHILLHDDLLNNFYPKSWFCVPCFERFICDYTKYKKGDIKA